MKRKILIFLIFAAILLYSSQVPTTVKNQAERIANGRPFCIQVAASGSYKAITGFGDILGIRMLGHGGYHHSVLIVGDLSNSPDTYHWSYWQNRFVSGTYGPFPIYCVPSNDYFSKLPMPNDSNGKSFSLLGINFSIPNEYHSEPLWPGSAVGLLFLAKAPNFTPVNTKCDFQNCNIYAELTKTFELEIRLKAESLDLTDNVNLNFGLSTQKNIRSEYYARNSEGVVVTAISCYSSCLHEFDSDGWRYTFKHMRQDLKDWLAMERKIVTLTKSFIVRPNGRYN